MRQHASQGMVQKILNTSLNYHGGVPNRAIWMLNTSGNFTYSSTIELVRKKMDKTMFYTLT